MLKKIIYDEIGINIEIGEGDGMPYDFIVRTSLIYTDKEKQMFALLDCYKIAGKSYLYINELVSYETVWEDYECEACDYSAEWSPSWVCERKQKEVIIINVAPYYYGVRGLKLIITASKALPRTISITVKAHFGTPDWNITLPAGFTGAAEYRNADFDLQSFYISPMEDIDYIYKITNNII